MGLVGFWFLEVSSLLFVYMLFSFFLSGHMFPLDMLPRAAGDTLVELTPLQYLAYFPGGRVPGKDSGGRTLARAWASKLAWVVFFIVPVAACSIARGTRRYSALWRLIDCRIDAMPASLLTCRVFLTFARNSLVRDMTFRVELPHRVRLVASPGC